jgi:MFS family permease
MSDPAAPALSGDVVAEVIDNGQVSGQQLLVVGLCMFFNMLDGFDITAMAIVASSVSQELQLTADRLGLIFSFALAGMMVGAMVLAPVSDIIGRRKLIILSVTLVGVSILFTANASTLTEFMILRFISGLGAGAMLACQAALAAEYSPEKYRSLSVALTTAGYPLGATLTAVVAGFISASWERIHLIRCPLLRSNWRNSQRVFSEIWLRSWRKNTGLRRCCCGLLFSCVSPPCISS